MDCSDVDGVEGESERGWVSESERERMYVAAKVLLDVSGRCGGAESVVGPMVLQSSIFLIQLLCRCRYF